MGVAVDKLRPSNSFTLAKPKLNKHKGTATLAATVPEPGKLALAGKGVKKQTKKPPSAGRVQACRQGREGSREEAQEDRQGEAHRQGHIHAERRQPQDKVAEGDAQEEAVQLATASTSS